MDAIYTELDCYEDVVEGYAYITDFQVDFTAIMRDGFAEQVEVTIVRVDNETGLETPGGVSQVERTEIISAISNIAEEYFHEMF